MLFADSTTCHSGRICERIKFTSRGQTIGDARIATVEIICTTLPAPPRVRSSFLQFQPGGYLGVLALPACYQSLSLIFKSGRTCLGRVRACQERLLMRGGGM